MKLYIGAYDPYIHDYLELSGNKLFLNSFGYTETIDLTTGLFKIGYGTIYPPWVRLSPTSFGGGGQLATLIYEDQSLMGKALDFQISDIVVKERNYLLYTHGAGLDYTYKLRAENVECVGTDYHLGTFTGLSKRELADRCYRLCKARCVLLTWAV
jgi:hypothetical protein